MISRVIFNKTEKLPRMISKYRSQQKIRTRDTDDVNKNTSDKLNSEYSGTNYSNFGKFNGSYYDRNQLMELSTRV